MAALGFLLSNAGRFGSSGVEGQMKVFTCVCVAYYLHYQTSFYPSCIVRKDSAVRFRVK